MMNQFDRIREAMVARADRAITEALTGQLTTAANTAPQEPLTIDTPRRLMLKMPKPEVWLSTRLFPGADAMRVEGEDENFLVAHPDLWLKLQHHCERDMLPSPNLLGIPRPIFGIQIQEIDLHPDDGPERRAYLDGIWRKLVEAIKVARVELPEWLKAAPRFSEHG